MSITEVCNFKCGYCLPNGYPVDKSDNRKFLNIDENIPLISKRCAEELVAGLKKAIPADICISTTGLLQIGGVVYVSVLYNDIITTFHFTHNHYEESDVSKFDRTLGSECIIQKTISHIIDIIRKG